MAKHNGRVLVKMLSTESNHVYWTQKNKRSNGERLELRKFDPSVNRHVVYREAR